MTIELSRAKPSDRLGEKWRPCVLCQPKHKDAEVFFDSGSVEPTVGETLTGATSADTGVVVDTQLYDGSWADGDAEGVVTLTTLTGTSTDSDTLVETVFQDNENLNGSTAGDNCMTVDGTPQVNKYGRLYPQGQMVYRDGQWFCNAHAHYRYHHKDIDDYYPTIDEGNREEIW